MTQDSSMKQNIQSVSSTHSTDISDYFLSNQFLSRIIQPGITRYFLKLETMISGHNNLNEIEIM